MSSPIQDDPYEIVEQSLERLLWMQSAVELEKLLRHFGDSETNLISLSPLAAAACFRESMKERLRSGAVTAERLRMTLLEMESVKRIGTHSAPLSKCFERALFVFGLRRGGNHAIAEWLKAHFDESDTVYLNSAEIGFFKTGDNSFAIDQADYASIALNGKKSVLIVGYENLDFQSFPFTHNAGIAKRSDLIIVLRDYPNMAASIVKSARERPSFVYKYRLKDLPDNWTTYAQHFLARTGGFTYVKFNDWFSDAQYRKNLARILNLEFSDKGLNVVSNFGGGSSFEGMARDGEAQSMNVLNRWKEMADDDLFLFLLLANDSILELNERIFGNFPFSHDELRARWQTRP